MDIAKTLKAGLCSMMKPKSMMNQPLSAETLGNKPSYPHGLQLHLNADSMKRMGHTAKNYTVGQTMTVDAKVKVTSIRSDEDGDNVHLQITDMMVDNK